MTQARLTVLALDPAQTSGWAILILDPGADGRLLASGTATSALERQAVARKFAELVRARGGASAAAAETWTNKRTRGAMREGKKTGKLATKTLIGLGAGYGRWEQAFELACIESKVDRPKVIRWTPQEWREVIGAVAASGEVAKERAVQAALLWWGVKAKHDEAEAIAIGTRALSLPADVREKLGVRAVAGLEPFHVKRPQIIALNLPPPLPPVLPPCLPPRTA